MQDRLLAMGAWLKVNGEAIYGSRAWAKRPKDSAKDGVYFTEKDGALYVISFKNAPIKVADAGTIKKISLLGSSESVDYELKEGALTIRPLNSAAPGGYAKVWKVER